MHLSDCFIEVMAYVSYWLHSVETKQPPYEDVKEEIWRLLSESEIHPARSAFPPEEFDQARFALCAWIDEAIVGSQWLHRNRWLNDQLQRFHYNTTDAGEEFFDRLDKVGLQQREVREVFYLCLAQGFTGRYCELGDQYHLEQIKSANLKLLLGSSNGLPSLEGLNLFPEAHPNAESRPAKPKTQTSPRIISTICLAAPPLLFCILYLIYHFTLSGISDHFLRTVTG
jgi:type VI secretion system protein ImpK